MITTYTDFRLVKAEMATRYPARRPVRRDSSLEIMRRTLARNSREELDPGYRR
ncbi:MAG TPA: hypothetical protein VFL38_18210 [Humibacillus xanthopallidus]|nr:hypothetical protein [Humibacillus xanthopallidus]